MKYGEFGMVAAHSYWMPHQHATTGLRLDKVRKVIASYDEHRATLPPHEEKDVAFLTGPVFDGQTPLAWYIDIPYVGKHRRPK